jgi:tRNA1(Val) A37 N6-methylase TrmN6
VFDLLGGQIPAAHPQQEAYRLLLVGACNAYHEQMGFLFEPIADYTELLMPGDLLSENSILQAIRNALTPETCRDVEVIGWLYQYYISERKDEVFANLKQNQKIQPQDIPAATQLFTPHWIVRYLVENSLGRLWLLNRPDSRLAESMDYYIQPEEQETDYLRLASPEEINLCDPACGSGHMLTYSFDLLYRIYEEEGYDPVQIPQLILEKNLYGIEIDQRAGALAAFALTMKAREKDRRFFRRQVTPNICVLENVRFTAAEINEYMDAVGRDLFTNDLWLMLKQFENADNYGALIRPQVQDVDYIRARLAEEGVFENLFLHATNQKVKTVLTQAEYLSQRYHVVVANPPYMGSRGMNAALKDLVKDQYPDSKSDTFAVFIERGFDLLYPKGYHAMVTMEAWMFLSSYEKLRSKLLKEAAVLAMVHMPYLGKGGTSMGINFGTAATILRNNPQSELTGSFSCVRYYEIDEQGVPLEFPVQNERLTTATSADFQKIPGSPIAYWATDSFREAFQNPSLSEKFQTRLGLSTANNDRFLRLWPEVSFQGICMDALDRTMAIQSSLKWFSYEKGGVFRKWFGNHDYVVNWENDGWEIRHFGEEEGRIRSHNYNLELIFREGITWSDITSGTNAFRLMPPGFLFDGRGSSGFVRNDGSVNIILGILNSRVINAAISMINPTLSVNVGEIARLPYPSLTAKERHLVANNVTTLISKHKSDWDTYEISWDFTVSTILQHRIPQLPLANIYTVLRAHWREVVQEMQRFEEENNRIFIEAYGLQDELTPDVPLREITLTCNPPYRYPDSSRKTRTEVERETLLLADTMREFISYAVGCMFGRYSLDSNSRFGVLRPPTQHMGPRSDIR